MDTFSEYFQSVYNLKKYAYINYILKSDILNNNICYNIKDIRKLSIIS